MAFWRWPYRVAYLIGFLVCLALLAYARYEQYLGLVPCYLCVLQRIGFAWMALWFLIGGLHGPRGAGRWVYAGLVCAGAVFGIIIAARQLWLQSLPLDQVPACGAPLSMMWAQLQAGTLPVVRFLRAMFSGSGDCAAVPWRFAGLSMAGWTVIWYVLLGAWALLPRPHRNRLGGVRALRTARS